MKPKTINKIAEITIDTGLKCLVSRTYATDSVYEVNGAPPNNEPTNVANPLPRMTLCGFNSLPTESAINRQSPNASNKIQNATDPISVNEYKLNLGNVNTNSVAIADGVNPTVNAWNNVPTANAIGNE